MSKPRATRLLSVIVDRPLDVRQRSGSSSATGLASVPRCSKKPGCSDAIRLTTPAESRSGRATSIPLSRSAMPSAGRRASYGASPGDASTPEPYLYVGPWGEVDSAEPFWNATGFTGATLAYADLLSADDPRAHALSFFRRGFELLNS